MKLYINQGRLRHLLPPKLLLIMRLIIVLLTTGIMQVSASSFAQNLTYSKQGASLHEIFVQIRKQTNYLIIYSDKKIDDTQKLDVNFNNTPIKEVLDLISEQQSFLYLIDEKTISIKPKESTFLEGLANRWAAIDVHGRVVDQEGKPLPGATVKVKTTGKSVSTNAKGEFYLEKVDEGAVLVISFIGYVSKEVDAGKEMGSVVLELSDSKLDEIQIIAYGTTTRRLSTGNVSTVKAVDIEKQPVNNPLLTLQGRVAGVEINQANGIAGGSVKITIRGINSLTQGRDPLYIIDGVPYSPSLYNLPGYGGLNYIAGGEYNLGLNPLSLINPQDIVSIDILKDADATAIYGSRASNGVVMITTKKGREGPTNVDINTQKGIGKVTRKARLLNTEQYLAMRREAFANDDLDPTVSNAKDLLSWDQNSYTDWQDLMIGGTSNYTDAQTSISGGNINTQFLISGNYHHETTVFPSDWNDEKGSLHFSISNISSSQRFKTTLTGSFASDNNQLPVTDYTQFIIIAPNAPSLYNLDGSLNWKDYTNNPFRDIKVRYTAKTGNLIANSIFSYVIIPGLEVKTSIGYNQVLLNEKRTSPIEANSPASNIKTGSSAFNTNLLRSWIIEPQLNYRHSLFGNYLSILFGGTIQQRNIEGQVVSGEGYTDNGLLGSLAGAETIGKGASIYEVYKYNSLFTRINYNWKDKYIVNLTGRRDGSSRFGPGKQFSYFGAIGSAWVFSEENFFSRLSLPLSFGKLRASYGTSGNEPGTNYAFLELYSFTNNFPYGGSLGISPNNLFAPDYRWEINRKLEISTELGFFKDRILFSTSFFQNRSSNQLITRPLSSVSGFQSIIANLPATIQNKGWEFTMSSTNVIKKSFKWRSFLNLSIYRNKLLAFPNLENSGYQYTYIVGKPINIRRVYKSAGINSNTGYYEFYDKNYNTNYEPSAPTDQISVIDPNPRFYGGLSNNIQYKNISLDFLFQFVKQIGQNYLFASSLPPGFFAASRGIGNQPNSVLSRWTKANKDANFQRYSQSGNGLNSYNLAKSSDLQVSDASFIRLKNISLSYRFDSQLIDRYNLKGLRVYMQAQNPIVLTNYKGMDPETQSFTNLPPLRVITAGIQIVL